jgi:hypothetical protein
MIQLEQSFLIAIQHGCKWSFFNAYDVAADTEMLEPSCRSRCSSVVVDKKRLGSALQQIVWL